MPVNDSDKLTEILKGVSCTVHMQSNSAGHPSVRGELTGLEAAHTAILTLFEGLVPDKREYPQYFGNVPVDKRGFSDAIESADGFNDCRTQILKNIGRLRK